MLWCKLLLLLKLCDTELKIFQLNQITFILFHVGYLRIDLIVFILQITEYALLNSPIEMFSSPENCKDLTLDMNLT